MTLYDKLTKLNACPRARNFVQYRDVDTVLAECPTPDWLIWLLIATNRVPLAIRLSVLCIQTVQHRWPSHSKCLDRCCKAILRWVENPGDQTRAAVLRAHRVMSKDFGDPSETPVVNSTRCIYNAVMAVVDCLTGTERGSTAAAYVVQAAGDLAAQEHCRQRLLNLIRNDLEFQKKLKLFKRYVK